MINGYIIFVANVICNELQFRDNCQWNKKCWRIHFL